MVGVEGDDLAQKLFFAIWGLCWYNLFFLGGGKLQIVDSGHVPWQIVFFAYCVFSLISTFGEEFPMIRLDWIGLDFGDGQRGR